VNVKKIVVVSFAQENGLYIGLYFGCDCRALSESANTGGLIFFMPWLRHIMPEYLGYAATRRAFEQLRAFVEDSVKEHQKTFHPDITRSVCIICINDKKRPCKSH